MRTNPFIIAISSLLCPVFSFGQVPWGFEIIQITDDPEYYDSFQDINNCAQIVFGKRLGSLWSDSEIFLYDNGSLVQITDNDDRDVIPSINDNGTMVWSRGIGGTGSHQIVMYENGQTVILVDNPLGASSATINNLGQVAWREWVDTGCALADTTIRFFDGTEATTIVTGVSSDQSPQLNDHGELVWTRYDWCVNPWDSDIFLHSEGVTTKLTTDQPNVQIPRINNLHQVVWGGPAGIQLWQPPGVVPEAEDDNSFGSITTITTDGVNPGLNNLGHISFGREREDTHTGQIWLYRDGQLFQITNDPLQSHKSSRLNDWGEMVWRFGTFPQGDVMFMRRIRTGEADFDDHVDWEDHAVLFNCLTGPVETDGLCDCRFLDMDHDRDVDLGDFALFQQAFTGRSSNARG